MSVFTEYCGHMATKVFIRRYLALMFAVSGRTVYRKFGPDYSPLKVRKYLIDKGFKSRSPTRIRTRAGSQERERVAKRGFDVPTQSV